MSRLILVRHGQASFLSDDYDRLSERGEEQARLLGEHLAREGITPTDVFSGPRRRQLGTARLAISALAKRGTPDVVTLDDLDEHHGGELMAHHVPKLAAASPVIGELAMAFANAADAPSRARQAERILREAMTMWAAGHPATAGVESFAAFRARARRALAAMTASEARSRTVLAFTSGGTIGAIAAEVLEAGDRQALELGFVSENASYTEISFSGARRSLHKLGVPPGLPRELRTYR